MGWSEFVTLHEGWNKALVIFSLNWIAFTYGYTHGQIAGLIAALQAKDEGIVMSEAQISLIASFLNLIMVIGFLFIALLGDRVGRRFSYIICSVLAVVNWIILYYANEFAGFMISRLLAGLSIGPLSLLNTVVSAEFLTQRSRALHLSIITVLTPTLGIATAHILGVLFHWRHLALLGAMMCTIQIALPYFWVESPHWLAMRGRFEECQMAFRKLHGSKESTDSELAMLVRMEMNKQKSAEGKKARSNLRKLTIAFRKRYFWDLMLMSSFIYTYYTAAGKVIFSSLATVILQEITGATDVLLYTLLVDGFVLLGTFISCFIVKKSTIRTMLFSSGLTAVGVLFFLSACLYFRNGEMYFQWINVTLLALYFIIVHAGPYPVMEILIGEMFPLELKLYCFVITSPIIMSTVFLSILLLPYMVSVMGYHGLFLLNSGIMLACLAFLYVRLPETKGKTLQEIEVYFKTKNFDIDKVLSNKEQIDSLL